MINGNAFIQQVEGRKKKLTPTQQRIAEFMINNLEEAVFMTADAVANRLKVSPSTVVRFASALGYRGYPDMQESLRSIVRSKLSLPERVHPGKSPVTEHSDAYEAFTQAVENDLRNVEATVASLGPEVIEQTLSLVTEARRVYVFGVRSSYGPAHFFYLMLQWILGNVELLRLDEGVLPERLAELSADDLVILITFPRHGKVVLDVAEHAASLGAKVLLITGSLVNPISHHATLTIPVRYTGTAFHNSHVATLAVVNGLIASLAVFLRQGGQLGERAILERTENMLRKWALVGAPVDRSPRAFWQNDGKGGV